MINTLLFDCQMVDIGALVGKSTLRAWRGENRSNTGTRTQKLFWSRHTGQKPLQSSQQRIQMYLKVLQKHPGRKSLKPHYMILSLSHLNIDHCLVLIAFCLSPHIKNISLI